MLDNVLILSIGALLAAVCLVVWILFPSSSLSTRLMLVAVLNGFILGAVLLLAGERAALAVLMLGLIFTTLGKLATINFNMVHTANYPKHRRCY